MQLPPWMHARSGQRVKHRVSGLRRQLSQTGTMTISVSLQKEVFSLSLLQIWGEIYHQIPH